MTTFKPKKANAFLSRNRELPQLFAKIKQIDELNQLVSEYLDARLQAYCKVAHLAAGRLTLVAANGAVATQVRFLTNHLLKQFATHPTLKYIKEIHCKVHPSLGETRVHNTISTKIPRRMPLLSADTADMVQSIADSLEDPELRAVMQRIAEKKKRV